MIQVNPDILEAHYHEKASWRTWYRTSPIGSRAHWQDLARENRAALRELVAIRWEQRQQLRRMQSEMGEIVRGRVASWR